MFNTVLAGVGEMMKLSDVLISLMPVKVMVLRSVSVPQGLVTIRVMV